MPIYEYKCQACDHQFETMQKFSDAPLSDCPQCGKASLQKLISATGFQLKGTGWYVTDFKNNGKKPADKNTSAAVENKTANEPAKDSGDKKKETKKTDEK